MAMMTSERILRGRYQLLHQLGAGGMGSVWLAEDRWLQRTVALKQLVEHAGGADLDEHRARALQEARAMARVRHPAIVSILDVFFDGEDPWIVMEYISGRSLDAIIRGANRAGRLLDEQEIAAIGLPVLGGLCAAHRASVVHRDVKPANILVADDESVFLVDFGIAKISGAVSLTSTRTVMGTAEFLAPERIRGEEAGPAADLWSLGITLFYALEGYSPFLRGGSCPEATMWAILREDPPPPARRGRLADVVLRLLDKDPVARAGADELADALRSITSEAKSPHPEPVALPQAVPQPRVGRPAARTTRRHQPTDVRQAGLAFEDVREVILSVSADTGVATLLAMPDDQAAKILASCPSDVSRELLHGVAAAWPGKAGAMLRMLLAADAGRVVDYLKPDTAASILAAAPPDDAAQILSGTGVRTAARIIAKMPVEAAAPITKLMPAKKAAEVLGHVQPAAFRAQVMRLL
jgi:eukaryotic-like serine/threonine-protein kinase